MPITKTGCSQGLCLPISPFHFLPSLSFDTTPEDIPVSSSASGVTRVSTLSLSIELILKLSKHFKAGPEAFGHSSYSRCILEHVCVYVHPKSNSQSEL